MASKTRIKRKHFTAPLSACRPVFLLEAEPGHCVGDDDGTARLYAEEAQAEEDASRFEENLGVAPLRVVRAVLVYPLG